MRISWIVTGDGLLAFVGGALALIGVWWSNHQSVKNLRKQLDAEKESRSEEVNRQRSATATALLYEIDSFFMMELAQTEKALDGLDLNVCPLPKIFFSRPNCFDVYKANAAFLGCLDPASVSAIVKFYTMAGTFEVFKREYQHCIDGALRGIRTQDFENTARARLKDIYAIIPSMKALTTNVCNRVAKNCNLENLVRNDDAQTH